jgi:competence protein ComEC
MTAPALVVSLPLLLGVLAGASLDAVPAALGPALIVSWVLSAAATWAPIGRAAIARLVRTAGIAFGATGCLLAGTLLGAAAARAAAHPTLLAWHAAHGDDRPVRLTGVLRDDATTTGTAVSLLLDATAADGEAVEGGVRVSVGGGLAPPAARAWRAGRTLALDVTLREPLDYRDPGVPSDRARLARQGIVLLGTAKSAALVTLGARGSVVSEAAARLRAFVRAGTAEAVGRWSQVSAGVVTAILIGDRTGLSPEDERRLQEAGTYHVIAISGGNIALLTAMLVALGRVARLPARSTAAASIGLLAFYGYAAGLAPSVLRATVAGMIYLAARAADHRGAALNAVAVAAAFACVAAPLSVLDPGFILSFSATFAIIVAVTRLAPARPAERAHRRRGRLARLGRSAWAAARALGAATICAEIALAPVGARLFGRLTLAGLILNFAAIPLMSIIQAAGLVAVLLVRPAPPLAAAAGWIAHAGTIGLLRSAALVDAAPWLLIDVAAPAWWTIACWYAGWTGVFFAHRRSIRLASAALVAVAAVPVAAGAPAARQVRVAPPLPGWTRLVFLDVGQGDATLVEPAGSEPLLVDAGGVPGSPFDLGRRVTLPALWAFGVRRLSALVLTHGDPDHIGGAPPLLRALRPEAVWEGVPVPSHDALRRLHAEADRRGIPWLARRAGDVVTAGGLALRVLNPPPPDWERPRVRNDDSIVIEARTGGVSFLLPGDITQAVEPEVVARVEAAPIAIVKAPHHGSAGSSSPRFVEALHPALVVFSAGRRNPFGHPAPAIVERYRAAGARVYSTADDGAVVVDTDGDHVVVWCPATGRREAFTVRGR